MRSVDQKSRKEGLGEPDEEKGPQYASDIVADFAESDGGGATLRLIDVEEESAETGTGDAEKEAETEEDGCVEEKGEVALVEMKGEERGDEGKRDEVARTDR